jgi:tetratricopeptide (TPR) repeat protein
MPIPIMATQITTYAQRYFQAALDFFDQGQYGKALEHINKAIEKSPGNADFFSTKGVFLHKMNDLAQAIEAYRQTIELNPSHTFAHFNLGLILMKLGKTIEAIQEWEAVIKVNPRDVNAIFNIAVALAQIGRRKEAILFYEKALGASPTHVQTHQNLGILYRDDGNFDKAKFHLNRLKELDVTYAEVVNEEIRRCQEQEFLMKTSKVDHAKIAKDTHVTLKGTPGPDVSDGLMAFLEGNFDRALHVADDVLAQYPSEVQARILRGEALGAMGRAEEAIAEFLGIIAEHPDLSEPHFHVGNIFLGMEAFEKALEHFERVRKLDPNFPLIEENVQNLLKKKGKR